MAREIHTGGEMAKNIAEVLRAGRAGIPRDLDKLGVDLQNQMRLELSEPGRGRIYTTYFWTDDAGRIRRGRPRVPHQASAPGDPPAVDEGKLRASYGFNVERGSIEDVLVFGTGDPKAKYLEFGTRHILPRPHLRPLMNRNRPRVREVLADGIEGRERAMARRLGGRG